MVWCVARLIIDLRTRTGLSQKEGSMSELKKVDGWLIGFPTPDGMLTSAAALRNVDPNCQMIFTHPAELTRVHPRLWGPAGKTVMIIGLPAHRVDGTITSNFLRRIIGCGHRILGVCDTHNAQLWITALEAAGISIDGLSIKPANKNGGAASSSGNLLLAYLEDDADSQTMDLCIAADLASRGDFSTHFGGIVHKALLSAVEMADRQERHVYLAKHLAWNRQPDAQIQAWLEESEILGRQHDQIINGRTDLGCGLVSVSITDQVASLSELRHKLFGLGYKIIITNGFRFTAWGDKKGPRISVKTSERLGVNIRDFLRDAGLTVSGSFNGVDIRPEERGRAIEALKQLLMAKT